MSTVWTALIWVLVVAPPAQAYLDPSTGSMIISAIVGLIASLGLALKSYWYRAARAFRSRGPPVVGSDAAVREPGRR